MNPCPVCDVYFESDDPLFEIHVNSHFESEENTINSLPESQTLNQNWEIIKSSLSNSSAVLCAPIDYYSNTKDDFWPDSCGYRNLQMLLSSLVSQGWVDKVYSVNELQILLEESWNAGFDITGGMQLNFKVVGTNKWIGSTEVANVLHYLRIRFDLYLTENSTKLYDFHQPTGPNRQHPRLVEMVKNYYGDISEKGVSVTNRTPLYFQHQGHSQSIIGIERNNEKEYLLLYDPNQKQTGSHLVKLPVERLSKHRQYSILSVEDKIQESDIERYKELRSTRIP
ncbi:peptidase family C78-domain-containing protein [Globomyces pollinis-pini]|nr:peptidase family C78-domain-containing protein [Globomyces pollinis-pini]